MADTDVKTLAETENYAAWTSEEDGETLYHIELGQVTVHLFREEWEELIQLINAAGKNPQK